MKQPSNPVDHRDVEYRLYMRPFTVSFLSTTNTTPYANRYGVRPAAKSASSFCDILPDGTMSNRSFLSLPFIQFEQCLLWLPFLRYASLRGGGGYIYTQHILKVALQAINQASKKEADETFSLDL